MSEKVTRISELYQLSETIFAKAAGLNAKMENNRTEDMEELPILFAKRQEAIEILDALMKTPGFAWTAEERKLAVGLAALEKELQPLLNGLHGAYKIQMEHISQTKQISVKYKNSYQNTSVDGTFFDARK